MLLKIPADIKIYSQTAKRRHNIYRVEIFPSALKKNDMAYKHFFMAEKDILSMIFEGVLRICTTLFMSVQKVVSQM